MWEKRCKRSGVINLRGTQVEGVFEGQAFSGEVITHIRHNHWLISTRKGHLIVPREHFHVKDDGR